MKLFEKNIGFFFVTPSTILRPNQVTFNERNM